MSFKRSVFAGFSLVALNTLVSLTLTLETRADAVPSAAKDLGSGDRYKNLELFQRIIHLVETKYVDSVKNQELIYGAIKGMIETLDPHSAFLTPEVLREMKTDTSGEFGGIGIELGVKDGVLTIISPIEDTPAWRAGLKPNDRIIKISGESTKGMTLQDAVMKMRGKHGSALVLGIYRQGFDKVKEVSVKREQIKIQSVKSEELEPGFEYIRLSSFNQNAAADVRKALEKFESKQKIRGLVFDLRMNPGGLLDQAVEVASLFLEDVPVVITKDRTQVVETKFARKGAARRDFPMAVLVNSSSASAAEIVAGALQDHRRALIMGQTTFGKGSVQQVMELGNDIGLKLTIQRYYTPSGRSIQEKGVQPDIALEDYDPKLLAEARRRSDFLRERDLRGHMANPDDATASVGSREFKKDELESLGRSSKRGKKSDVSPPSADGDELAGDEWAPIRFSPNEDYQVQMALKTVKSFDIFKKLVFNGSEVQSQAPATASK